jgi:hypothetical protein
MKLPDKQLEKVYEIDRVLLSAQGKLKTLIRWDIEEPNKKYILYALDNVMDARDQLKSAIEPPENELPITV